MKFLQAALVGAGVLTAPLATTPAAAQNHTEQSAASQLTARQLDRQRSNGRYEPCDASYEGRARDGDEARRYRVEWRDTRRNARWDDDQHNGYYDRNLWRFGPPPRADRANYTPGYHPWSRGDRLGYYEDRFDRADYRDLDRRQPRRGYRWVEDDRGDYLLFAIATGVISDVIVNRNY